MRKQDNTEIHSRIDKENRQEINDYLNHQKSISATVQLALLISKKAYGNQDLQVALNKASLSGLNLNKLNTKAVGNDKEEPTKKESTQKTIPTKKEFPEEKAKSQATEEQRSSSREPLDPAVVQMFLGKDNF